MQFFFLTNYRFYPIVLRDGKEMTLKEALNEQMKDESFKKEYEALAPEYEIISSLIDVGM